MVRSMHYGPHFSDSLKELSTKGFSTGLVLGSHLGDRAFAVCLVETPAEASDGTEVEKTKNIDVSWMLEHARQVYRLLPGKCCSVMLTAFIKCPFQVELPYSAALSSTTRTSSPSKTGKSESWLEESQVLMKVSLTIRSS